MKKFMRMTETIIGMMKMKFRFIRLLEYPFGKKKRKKIVKKNIKPQYKPKIKKDKLAVVDLIECERKKADKIPPFRIEGDQIIKNILGINFYFCEESYKKFVNEFASAGLDTEYDDYECYLIRRKGDYVESFHRWLMNNKLEEMAREKMVYIKPGEEMVIIAPPEKTIELPKKEDKNWWQKLLEKIGF